MEEALMSLIRGDASVTAALGDRVNWLRRPQSDTAYPACVLQRTSGGRKYHTLGPDGLSESRIQIDIWGNTYTDTKAAMRAVLNVLTGYRGSVSGTQFQGIFIESERDLQDEENDANHRLFRVSADALIWHTE